jgi:hypothetical protein
MVGSPTQQKWITKLLGYDFLIEYKKGKDNKVAGALSWEFEEVNEESSNEDSLFNITFPNPTWVEDIKRSYESDAEIQSRIAELLGDTENSSTYSLRSGLLLYKGRIVVGNVESLRTKILHLVHNNLTTGHSNYQKTLHRAKQDFYRPRLRSEIRHYIRGCDMCQRQKHETLLPSRFLQPLPIPTRVWADISMDFIEGLHLSQGASVIMVVVDQLGKYAHFMPIAHPFTATKISNVFMNNVFKLHGMLVSIICNTPPFTKRRKWKFRFLRDITTSSELNIDSKIYLFFLITRNHFRANWITSNHLIKVINFLMLNTLKACVIDDT